jgi:hypothetical protein
MTLDRVISPDAVIGRIMTLEQAIRILDAEIRKNLKKFPVSDQKKWFSFKKDWSDARTGFGAFDLARLERRLGTYEMSYVWWSKQYAKNTGKKPSVILRLT